MVNKIRSNQGRQTLHAFGKMSWFNINKIPLNEEDRAYLESLNSKGSFRHKILSTKVQAKLAILAQNGNLKARDKLIKFNIGLVISVAQRYVNKGKPLSELIDLGNQGFLPAIRKFMLGQGATFPSYAIFWIRQAITSSFVSQYQISIPINRLNEWNKISKHEDDLHKELEGEPSVERIAERSKRPVKEIKEYIQMSRWLLSLDAPPQKSVKHRDENNCALGDLVPDHKTSLPDKETFQKILEENVNKCLRRLPKRDRTIIEYRFELDGKPRLSYRQLGEILHVSSEDVRQLEKRIRKNLRENLKQYRDGF